ncbi:MAG: carboxyltransferase domain-containing protein [Pseudomonadota bacterium]
MTLTLSYPMVRNVGFDGVLVTFAETMSDPANRAALSFRAEVERLNLDGVLETSATLGSAYLRFDPVRVTHADMAGTLKELLKTRDWYTTPLPSGRKLWRVPTVYGTDLAPQLEEAARVAGLSPTEAVRRLSQTKVRVLTIGFASGQPYLGPLGPEFNIPRLQDLTPMVPEGALVLAISQFVLFSGPTPTGWRHIGQTAFRCFRPDMTETFTLTPGDELLFEPISRDDLECIRANNDDGLGGATFQEITS